MRDPREIVIEPILTEKAQRIQDESNQYVFRVAPNANKIEIKKAVESRFSVKVKSLRVMNVKGKPRQRFTRGGKVSGFTAAYKKAVVTLDGDARLDFVDNV